MSRTNPCSTSRHLTEFIITLITPNNRTNRETMTSLQSFALYPTLIYKEAPKTAESGQATIWQPSGNNTGSSACTQCYRSLNTMDQWKSSPALPLPRQQRSSRGHHWGLSHAKVGNKQLHSPLCIMHWHVTAVEDIKGHNEGMRGTEQFSREFTDDGPHKHRCNFSSQETGSTGAERREWEGCQ